MAKQLLDRILRPREVTEVTGLSRTTIWRGVNAGTFPKPVRLTASTIGWCQTDLAHWLAERRAAAGLSEDEQSTVPRKQVPAEQSLGVESDRVTRPPRKGCRHDGCARAHRVSIEPVATQTGTARTVRKSRVPCSSTRR